MTRPPAGAKRIFFSHPPEADPTRYKNYAPPKPSAARVFFYELIFPTRRRLRPQFFFLYLPISIFIQLAESL